MNRFPTLGLMTALGFVAFSPAKASAQDASAILEKAIKALGGEEKLTRASAHSWKAKGKVSLGGAAEREFNSQGTVNGFDHFWRETVFPRRRLVVLLDGDKGWHRGGNVLTELTGDELANVKRIAYLQRETMPSQRTGPASFVAIAPGNRGGLPVGGHPGLRRLLVGALAWRRRNGRAAGRSSVSRAGLASFLLCCPGD
jgi:hypothetical protein